MLLFMPQHPVILLPIHRKASLQNQARCGKPETRAMATKQSEIMWIPQGRKPRSCRLVTLSLCSGSSLTEWLTQLVKTSQIQHEKRCTSDNKVFIMWHFIHLGAKKDTYHKMTIIQKFELLSFQSHLLMKEIWKEQKLTSKRIKYRERIVICNQAQPHRN